MIDTQSSSPNNFEFIIEEEKNSYELLLPAFLSRSDQNLREIRIQILDEFGSINNILEISSYNHEIAFQQIIDLKYFQLRHKYFNQKLNKDLIRLIYEQLCLNEGIRSVQCIKRKFKVFEYIDKDSTASKVFYKRKLMRKSCFPIFHYYKDCSFSENLTAILFRHSQIYLNDIQTGRTIGVYNLELPQDCQFYSLFLISNNGLYAYYDHYLMENFKSIKQIKCSYVQFRKNSKQTLLYNLQGNLELFDLIKHQTLFIIRISLITFTDCKYYDFDEQILMQFKLNLMRNIKYQLSLKSIQSAYF